MVQLCRPPQPPCMMLLRSDSQSSRTALPSSRTFGLPATASCLQSISTQGRRGPLELTQQQGCRGSGHP